MAIITQRKKQESIEALANVLEASEMVGNDVSVRVNDNLIVSIDSENFITVVDAAVGSQIADIDFSDIVPNRILIQEAFEKYRIDSSFPIVYDLS